MKKIFLTLIALFYTAVLIADQAAWITKEQAERGAILIRNAGEIRHYCEPCGDNFYRAEEISSSVAAKAEGSDPDDLYYEVIVNGQGVDLAYVYVRSGGKWMNAAMLLKIDVTGVPEYLPGDLRNEKVAPEDLEEK